MNTLPRRNCPCDGSMDDGCEHCWTEDALRYRYVETTSELQRVKGELEQARNELGKFSERNVYALRQRAESAEAKIVEMAEALSKVQLKLRRAGHHMTADEIAVALAKLPERAKLLMAVVESSIEHRSDHANPDGSTCDCYFCEAVRAYQLAKGE